MSNKILNYASRTGSTRGVAETIGKTLTECGAQVDVLAKGDILSVLQDFPWNGSE